MFFIMNSRSRVSKLFSVKNQTINNLGIAGLVTSVTTTELRCSAKADIDDM